MGRTQDKVALISGGSRGMGAAHARLLVAEGAKVVIGDLLDESGAALAAELGNSARYTHLDVTNAEQWDAAVALAVRDFGQLNVLVNNAGIVLDNSPTRLIQNWRRVLDIPLGRSGAPSEVSPIIVFLASDESSYCTGSEFIVDGGLTAGLPRNPHKP